MASRYKILRDRVKPEGSRAEAITRFTDNLDSIPGLHDHLRMFYAVDLSLAKALTDPLSSIGSHWSAKQL